MTVTSVAAPAYDPLKAAFYGELVNAAYAMYDNKPTNPTPTPPAKLPGNYTFVAWVQMQDFFISESPYTFYGLIARNPSGTNDYVLAIRGTSSPEEWWDDFVSMNLVQMTGFGPSSGYANVGYGFYRIYQTLRVIYPAPAPVGTPGAMAARAPSQSLEAAGSFADQVAEAVHRHAAETAPPAAARPEAAAGAKMSVTVAGHSLGSALATLYVADNSVKKKVETPLLCTLASPRVGDWTFKTTFDNLGIPSWRIVNEPDVVPRVPLFGFWHINTEHEYDSGFSTIPSLECWHSIYTYLHLLDSTQPLSPSCVWSAAKPAAAAVTLPSSMRPMLRAPVLATAGDKEIAVAAPSPKEIAVTAQPGTTINITIKVG